MKYNNDIHEKEKKIVDLNNGYSLISILYLNKMIYLILKAFISVYFKQKSYIIISVTLFFNIDVIIESVNLFLQFYFSSRNIFLDNCDFENYSNCDVILLRRLLL